MDLLIKKGKELQLDEITQINLAKAREFNAPPLNDNQLSSHLHFLLLENDKIIATGELLPVDQINFDGEIFSILGIGGIVANAKGKGHGKQIMTAIRNYLIENNKTGVGFCRLYNKGFYEKCGFIVDENVINRFVYYDGEKKITDTEDHCVFWVDSSDNFMAKVLSKPNIEILLNRPPNW
jgi:hypothetical protein